MPTNSRTTTHSGATMMATDTVTTPTETIRIFARTHRLAKRLIQTVAQTANSMTMEMASLMTKMFVRIHRLGKRSISTDVQTRNSMATWMESRMHTTTAKQLLSVRPSMQQVVQILRRTLMVMVSVMTSISVQVRRQAVPPTCLDVLQKSETKMVIS